MQLVLANRDDLPEFQKLAAEFMAYGNRRFEQAITDPEAFMSHIVNTRHESTTPAGFVPQTIFWPKVKGVIVGYGALRHRLTDSLQQFGGHIGYAIRPTAQRRGYGTTLLGLMIQEASQMNITTVLITCDDDNMPSWRIIEKNGGQLTSRGSSPFDGKLIRRYVIKTNRIKHAPPVTIEGLRP